MQPQQNMPSTHEKVTDVHEFLEKILFTNDVTDGDTFLRSRLSNVESPEQEMFFSILEEACWDFTSNISSKKSAQRKLFQEVLDWFFNEHNSSWEGSFEKICEMFDINCNYFRKGIILWVKRKFNEPVPTPEVSLPKINSKVYSKFVDISEII